MVISKETFEQYNTIVHYNENTVAVVVDEASTLHVFECHDSYARMTLSLPLGPVFDVAQAKASEYPEIEHLKVELEHASSVEEAIEAVKSWTIQQAGEKLYKVKKQ